MANRRMNRERGLVGGNGYAKDLGFNPVEWLGADRNTAWLDLCCGSGRALVEAAAVLPRCAIVGVDLVPMFVAIPAAVENVGLEEGSVLRWAPRRKFDLITCIHGLHYVGDKLEALVRAAAWLAPKGRLCANLDLASLKGVARPKVKRWLEEAGFEVDARRRRISRVGEAELELPFEYLGADDSAGPNYTGQAAIDSHYRLR